MTDPVRVPAAALVSLPLVGRERELATLRAALASALIGQGALALIGGEAGVGKTCLAEWLLAEATAGGALALVGSCYDLAETPPYGPWRDLFDRAPGDAALPNLPAVLLPPERGGEELGGQEAIFRRAQSYLGALAAHRPLVLLLEDLHWADPASLDLLRALARSLATMPVLLIVTFRSEDVARDHHLYALLPVLVREVRPLRLELRPLDAESTRALAAARYPLPPRDLNRLAAWLQARAEGNPFYAGELLRGLEEEGLLRRDPHCAAWSLGQLAQAALPPMLRQVIDGRIARLGGEAHRALAVAAVIGQEVPLALWAAVSQLSEETLLDIVAAAEASHLLIVTADGTAAHFGHALIRESVYAGTPTVQRRGWHRRAGAILADLPDPDPDAVAYHLRQGGDPRAVDWLLRAGYRAERAYAWRIAADRCDAALALLDRRGAAAAERGWLAYRIAALRRYRDPRGALATLEAGEQLAAGTGDRVLAACMLFLRGNLHCYAGEFGPGLPALLAGIAALDALDVVERDRLRTLGTIGGFAPGTRHHRGTLALRLAGAGRFAEACLISEPLLAPDTEPSSSAEAGDLAEANAARGLAIARAAMGPVDEARRAFARARAAFQRLGDHFHVGVAAAQELQWVALPYRADRPTEIDRLVTEAERAWVQAGDAVADLPRGFARLPILLRTGDWAAARELALAVHGAGGSYKAAAVRALSLLVREQGDHSLAWQLIREELPAGPETPVGTANFSTALVLQRLAAALALDAGKAADAGEWLAAHDRWLDWSGAALGRAEGQLAWAALHRATGDLPLARACAERALALASEPRQPLALEAAQRLLGEFAIAARRFAEATARLEEALALADACAAPYERALTLLALAELHLLDGKRAPAHAMIDEARAICLPLAATPALARIAALAARLAAPRQPHHDHPLLLSTREVEVLQRVAAGESNRDIATALSLSVRTVEKHIAHVYAKLGARGRADAAAYAVRHGLLPEAAARR
ncbi:MAG: AAA family ATPase [Chloroflexia bacterium]